ncbi:hypothetical protein [Brevundimonas diminuta]|uniref:hypothetical protein n=1 Tax=Brevundimonas diminuta TaxID=293 RepID=UPI00320B5E86
MGVSIARTAELWRQTVGADEDIMDRLESIILRHTPKSAEEAAAMLDVVAVNVSAGQRCDGLDIRAIHAVASWLRNE